VKAIMLVDNWQATQTTQYAMGTVMTHKAFGPFAEDALAAVSREIERIETHLSRFLPDSDISRVNRSAGVKSEQVGPDAYEVLAKALEFSSKFPGCFDVTIQPLINLWKTARVSSTVPDQRSIWQALSLVNDRDVLLDPLEQTAGLKKAGQSIDLGGIGKGYAGDQITGIFEEYGIASAYSNLGGNVVAWGAKPDGAPWRVGIQHPRQERKIIGVVSAMNQSVVTSGDYQRFYTDQQGKRRHHILDPLTGYPAESGLISVTIVSEDSLAADALSTIVFVAGMEKGLEFLKRAPGCEAVLVDADLRVFITGGLKYRFQAVDDIDLTILDGS
jgi:thiamine biosynthesis lipoprotein